MKNLIRGVWVGALTILSAAAHPVDDAMEAFAADWVRGNPVLASRTQYFTGAEQAALEGQLTPVTSEYKAERAAQAAAGLAMIRALDTTGAPESTLRAKRTLEWLLEDYVREAQFDDFYFPLNQFTGVQRYLVSYLASSMPIRHAGDARNYAARIGQMGGVMTDARVEMERREAQGMLLPDFILRATIRQMELFLAPEPADNLLATSFERRAAELSDLTAAERERLLAAVVSDLTESVYPAYRDALATLERQLKQATADAGIWRLPRGAEAYASKLRHYTNGDMTPQEIHELGLAEVARIEAEMDAILRDQGLTEGSVNARYKELEARIQPTGTDDPRPMLLSQYAEMVDDAVARSQSLFDMMPRAPVVVRREPLFSEASAAAHYSVPAADGSVPGIFWVPLPGEPYRMISRRSLAYHEAVPGHHFQLALQQEMEELPKWWSNRIFGSNSAYSEGWALYAEWLANDEGWYEGDPIGKLGYLSSELLRARRLVVDTGLHAFKWTRQQVIDYGISVSETERYVVYAGQATSYKVGQLTIVKLRREAEARLGDKFDLPTFHNIVLRGASAPLEIVRDDVEAWIAAQE
ncbi:DUF885 domain-containing protein [Actomonas aquatica]|uniref:DUF885 domain-containing protein n=1 Tax=Actomonas aquatica TaxID=2866162 RepID=A0ABZ1C6B7_9BACT|nr:DUF885 domain-containing protein [Opitutus sp. WL0086]WRQ87139.1 DUF885 domain-containing protein [Opitutus sp. WL0086]